MKAHILIGFFVMFLFVISCVPVDMMDDTVSKEDRHSWLMSRESTDPSMCASITTSKNFQDGCYENIAINTEDVSLCENINGNVDFCKSDYASETGDFSVCGTLSEENTRSNCYARLGKETYNAALCAKVERVSTRDDCFLSVSYGSEDPNVCDSIKEDKGAKDRCYHSMSIKLGDASYCYFIGGEDAYMHDCIIEVAGETAEFELCETIPADRRDDCIDKVYAKCKDLYFYDPTNLPYYCQPGVMSPAGVPMSYD